MSKILAKVNAVFAEDNSCLLNVGHEKSLKVDMKVLDIPDLRRGDKIEFTGQLEIEEINLDNGETFDGSYLICPDMKVVSVDLKPRVASRTSRAINLGSSEVAEPPFASE